MQEVKQFLFDPFPKQIEFVNACFSGLFRFILYGGSIRGGKTFAGLGVLQMLCLTYAGSRWVVVRKDLQTLKRNTFPSWEKIKFSAIIRTHNHDTQTVTFQNGSQIIFFGENYDKDKELNRWKGLECNGFLLEEINEMQEISYFKAIERAGSYIVPSGIQPPPLIMATCNPTQGWVKERFYKPWKAGTLSPDQLYIPANIHDNPYISDEYKASLKDLPRFEYMVFVEGNWDVQLKTGGEFLKDFDLNDHVRPIVFDPAAPVHVSLDENVQPYITLTVWQIHEKTKVKQVAEILARTPNNTVKKLSQQLARFLREKDFNDMIYIYGDRTSLKQDTKLEKGQNFFSIFQREIEHEFHTRLRLPKINPAVALSGNFINAIFESGFAGLDICIGEHCNESINDYIDTKEDADGTVKKARVKDSVTGVTYEKNGHITDTLRYFVCEAFKNEYMRYQSKGGDYKRILGKTHGGRR